MTRRPLRVAVISRHQLTRAGLTTLLSRDPDRVVVVDVSSHDGHIGSHDAVVYDLGGLVDSADHDLAHVIASSTPVVALVPHGRADLADGAVVAGVAELVDMDVTRSDLVQVIERVAAAERPSARQRREQHRQRLVDEFRLTDRELDILALIGSGVPNQQIAADLYLSINTVKTYVRTAYKKIGATTRPEAVLWVVRHALVPSD